MKTKPEQIYEAIGEGYGYNGTKEQCIEIIEKIINSDTKVETDIPYQKFIKNGWKKRKHYSLNK